MTAAEQNRAAARNTVALVLSRVFVAVLGWAGSVVAARALGSEEWGQFSFVFGLLGLMAVVTDLGIGRLILGQLMRDREDTPDIASSYIALRAVLGLLGYTVALGVVVIGGYPAEVVRATAVAGLVVVLATPGNALTVVLQSRLRLTVAAAAECIGQALQLIATVLAAFFAPVLLVLVLPPVLKEVVQLLLKLRAVHRGAAGPRPSGVVHAWRWRAMLAEAVPISIGMGLFTLLGRVDLLMLSKLDTFDSVGLYSVGFRFADGLALVAWALVAPALTLLVGAWPDDVDYFRDRVRHNVKLMALLASLAVVGFSETARPLLVTLYGSRFGPATDAARLLVAGGGLGMLTLLGLNVLMAMGRHRAYPVIGLVGLALNVVLNLVLIPRASYEGAAVAAVVTEATVCILLWLLVARGSVRGLVPWGALGAMTAVTVGCVALGQALDDRVPWLVLTLGAVGIVLLAGRLLRLPGTSVDVLRGPVARLRRARRNR